MAELVDLVINRGILLDVGIDCREVRLGLVVIVVGDEVLNGILREEVLKLTVELGRKGLVRGENKGRASVLSDDIGHRKGLPRTGHTEKNLLLNAPTNPLD